MKKILAMILMVTMLVSMSCSLAEQVVEEEPVCETVEVPEPVEEVKPEPVAETVEEKTEEKVEEKTEEKVEEKVEEKQETVEEIPEEEIVIEETEIREEDFSADVVLTLVNEGELYYGDVATLRVYISNANAEYVINWQYSDGGDWHTIDGEHETTYSFELNEINAGYLYRVAVEKIG